MPLPPLTLQAEFESTHSRIVECATRQRAALDHSEALFASLVDRAFRGELTAPATKPPSRTPKQLSLLDE